MASSPVCSPTPSQDLSFHTDHPLSFDPGAAGGTLNLENEFHAENYVHPINHHLPAPAGLSSTAAHPGEFALPSEAGKMEVSDIASYLLPLQSELFEGSSDPSDLPFDIDCIHMDEDKLRKDLEHDKLSHFSDEGHILATNIISNPPLYLSDSISPKICADVVSEEKMCPGATAQQTVKSTTTLSPETSFELPSVSAKPVLVSHHSVNHNQVEHNQPNSYDLRPSVPPTKLKTKLGDSGEYIPVLYMQVAKDVSEENQRSAASLNSIPNEAIGLVASGMESIKNNDIKNQQGHNLEGKCQAIAPVVTPNSKTGRQHNPVCNTPAMSHTKITPDPVINDLNSQKKDWMSQPGANRKSFSRPLYCDKRYTNPPISSPYAVHYNWPQRDWVGPRDQLPHKKTERKIYDQDNQKEKGKVKKIENVDSEYTSKSHHPTTSKKRSEDKSEDKYVKAEENELDPYWSNSYTTYNSGGWNPQAYYLPSYHSYYYPYYCGHQSVESRNHSQPYKLDNYDDWWRYDPRYDSNFDYDHWGQYEQSYWEHCDRQSNHSGYSTQSMPSTHSHQSHASSHSEQSLKHQNSQHNKYLNHDSSLQSTSFNEDSARLGDVASYSGACSPNRLSTPEQFSSPHCCARFGSGGQLVQVLPNLPLVGKPALVQIHSTELMLQECWDQANLQTFPGPLIKEKTHKTDVLEFIRNMSIKCLHDDTLKDKEASCLIWELIELVCRQNGKLLGTDISHLLLSSQRSPSLSKKSDLIDFTNEPLITILNKQACDAESATEDSFWTVPKDSEKYLRCFRELLIYGKKKDALETALSNGLWGHAFMLASKMDSRACSQVMSKFIDSIPERDVLQTFYQLMSGKIPLSASHCGVKDWSDWGMHLAMVLSNHTRFRHLHKKTITRMGDALASDGHCDAAIFCYMVVQLDVDTMSDKSDTFLFGVKSAPSFPFLRYATNQAIQRTELLEYGLSLGSDSVYLPNFQVFKFIYACRLAEAGLYAQAFQYCEVISNALLASFSKRSLILLSQLIELSAKIRHLDPQFKDIPDHESSSEPEWLKNLRTLRSQITEELNSTNTKQKNTDCLPTLNTDLQNMSHENTAGCDTSYNISFLNTEIQTKNVQLLPPAPDDILEISTKDTVEKSSQTFGQDPVEPKSKMIPVATHKDSPKPFNTTEHINSQALKPQIGSLSSSGRLLPERFFNTKDTDFLSEDPSNQATDSHLTLALPLPAPPTLQQMFPITVQSHNTEDIQLRPICPVSLPTNFTMSSRALPSTLSPLSPVTLAAKSESGPKLTTPLPFLPLSDQIGQHYQTQQSVTQSTGEVTSHSLSTACSHWVTGQNMYSQEIQRNQPPKSTSLLCTPIGPQPLPPTGYNGMLQSSYSEGSQTLSCLTAPSSASDILLVKEYSAKQRQFVEHTQLKTPPQASSLQLNRMLGKKPPMLLDAMQHAMREKTAPSVQSINSPKPLIPKLFVPQSPPPEPQCKKEESGWFSWLFRKRKEQSTHDTDKSNLSQTQKSTTSENDTLYPSPCSQSMF